MTGVEMSRTRKRAEDQVKEVNSPEGKVKFEVYGEEMIDKEVRQSGSSGRIYLPPDWVDRHVKIIRID